MPTPIFQTPNGSPAPWRCYQAPFPSSDPPTRRKVVGLTRSRDADGSWKVGLWAVDRDGKGQVLHPGADSSRGRGADMPESRSQPDTEQEPESRSQGEAATGSSSADGETATENEPINGKSDERESSKTSGANKPLRFATGSSKTSGTTKIGKKRAKVSKKKKECVLM